MLNNLLRENEGTNIKHDRKYLESKGYNPDNIFDLMKDLLVLN